MQFPLFAPESDWSPPSLDELPSWAEAKRVSIDTETYDPYLQKLGPSVRRGGFIAGISFAIEDGPSHYLPIRHREGGNLPIANVLSYLCDQAKTFRGDLVGAHLAYDLDYLAQDGIEFDPRYFRDVQIAAPLIYCLHESYKLEDVLTRLGLPGKDETKLREAAEAFGLNPKKDLWKLHSKYVGAYAERDAVGPLQALRRQETKIDDMDLWDVWNMESELLPVLVAVKRRGVRVNLQKVEEIEHWSLTEEHQALKKISHETGVNLGVGDVWTTQALVPALEAAGVEVGETDTGQPSITKEILANANHPVADALLWARKVNKLRTTFAASVREYETNGRIHCQINQIAREKEGGGGIVGARFGRMSMTHLNMQQQPARDEFGARWRSIYEPEPGSEWACNDYSQQEPRWTTHYAFLLGLQGAAHAVDRYRNDPNMDNHQFMADLIGWEGKEGRTRAKQIYLGLCYGEGGAKLSDQLGLPTRIALRLGGHHDILYFETEEQALEAAAGNPKRFIWRAAGEEAQEILDRFNNRAPFIKLLADRVKDKVEAHGIIRAADGRVIQFPQRNDGRYDWAHKGLNRLIQGSAAGQMKKAAILLHRELPEFFLQLFVHDEANASVGDRSIAHKAARLMEEALPASVPFVVKPKIGPSWGEIDG